MTDELNEAAARAIGWSMTDDGGWRNSWGASVGSLPDFSGTPDFAQVVVRAFEPSMQTRLDGTHEAFASEYRDDMTPTEICELGVAVARRLRPDRFR